MHPLIEFVFLGESVVLKTYSLFMGIAILVGTLLSWLALRGKVKRPLLFLLGLALSFLVGARLLNFLVNYQTYQNTELSLFTLRAVGFSFYGGILVAVLVLLILHYLKKINIWEVADVLILPFGISFFIMRIGCFLNGCCFGEITACPLGVSFPSEMIDALSSSPIFALLGPGLLKVHPTQLYEGFAALIGVVVFYLLRKSFKVNGLMTVFYGIYLTSVRWIVLYFRHLEYKDWVVDYFYPGLYFSLIVIGIWVCIYLKKKDKVKNIG